MSEYKEYELVGGQAAKIYPLTASEQGVYVAPEGAAFNPVISTGGGGGGAGIMVATATLADNYYTLDKTWAEMKSAAESGTPVFCLVTYATGVDMDLAFSIYDDDGTYTVYTALQAEYTTDAEDGYPSREAK